jgi:hypothetical protein
MGRRGESGRAGSAGSGRDGKDGSRAHHSGYAPHLARGCAHLQVLNERQQFPDRLADLSIEYKSRLYGTKRPVSSKLTRYADEVNGDQWLT